MPNRTSHRAVKEVHRIERLTQKGSRGEASPRLGTATAAGGIAGRGECYAGKLVRFILCGTSHKDHR